MTRVRCSGPLGSCSQVCFLRAWFCVRCVLGHLSPVQCCARWLRCPVCAVPWVTWLLFTSLLGRCVVLLVECPGPLGSCSTVCTLSALCCMCDVLPHLAPVHRCARLARCVACAVSWATWLLHAWCAPGRVRCLGAGPTQVHLNHGFFVAGRGWVPSGRAHVHLDSGWFIAGWRRVGYRARTCPSGRHVVGCWSWTGWATGLPGAFWCTSPFLLPSCFSFSPRRAACADGFLFFPLMFLLCAPFAFVFLLFLAPGPLGLGALCWPFPCLLPLVFFAPPFSWLFCCFWGAPDLVALWLPAAPSSFFSSLFRFFSLQPSSRFAPLLRAPCLGTAWLGFFSPPPSVVLLLE